MNYINNFTNFKNSRQFTLNKIINFSGVGVHNGRAVSMSVEPANINTGINPHKNSLPIDVPVAIP